MEPRQPLLQPIGQEELDQSQLQEIAAQVGRMSTQQSRLYQRNVERVVEAIVDAAKTGKVGDGKIFVTELHQVWRIRTGETGDGAL